MTEVIALRGAASMSVSVRFRRRSLMPPRLFDGFNPQLLTDSKWLEDGPLDRLYYSRQHSPEPIEASGAGAPSPNECVRWGGLGVAL